MDAVEVCRPSGQVDRVTELPVVCPVTATEGGALAVSAPGNEE